jgi:hypothetical protein
MTEDKPYGYVRADGEGLFIYGEHALQAPHGVEMVPVYRRQHREWIGLTPEEIDNVEFAGLATPKEKRELVRAIEAKLKEKNT